MQPCMRCAAHWIFFLNIVCLRRVFFSVLLSDKLNACHFNAQRKVDGTYKIHKRTHMHAGCTRSCCCGYSHLNDRVILRYSVDSIENWMRCVRVCSRSGRSVKSKRIFWFSFVRLKCVCVVYACKLILSSSHREKKRRSSFTFSIGLTKNCMFESNLLQIVSILVYSRNFFLDGLKYRTEHELGLTSKRHYRTTFAFLLNKMCFDDMTSVLCHRVIWIVSQSVRDLATSPLKTST